MKINYKRLLKNLIYDLGNEEGADETICFLYASGFTVKQISYLMKEREKNIRDTLEYNGY